MPSNILEQESMKKLMAQLFKDLPASKSQDSTRMVKPQAVVPVKEEVTPEPKPSHADFLSYRREDLLKPKPEETFSFDAHINDYNERLRRGKLELKAILSALVDNKKAYNYVKLYFETDPVQWNVKKFRAYLKSNITYWEWGRQKYRDGSAIYSENIMTAERILQTLDELDDKLKEIDRLAA